jgi:hypothetical protein
VFQDHRLEVVSRNLDGTWFEVRRPGRMTNLGWVFNEVLSWDFRPELLPLGDLTTGVIGPWPLSKAPAFAVYLREGPILRERPSRRSSRVTDIPPLVTIPVMERNQDGSWLHVNYLGYDGWILAFSGRELPNVLDIPQASGLPPLETISVLIIPVELQQAQIDHLREFINARREVAVGMVTFWWRVFRGEVMPCDEPEEITKYPYTEADVRNCRSSTLRTPARRSHRPHEHVARPLSCGVVSPEIVRTARTAPSTPA